MNEVNSKEKIENPVHENDRETQRAERQKYQASSISLIKEFSIFLSERKKFWLLPIVMIMILLGALIIFSQASVIAPFIYTIF